MINRNTHHPSWGFRGHTQYLRDEVGALVTFVAIMKNLSKSWLLSPKLSLGNRASAVAKKKKKNVLKNNLEGEVKCDEIMEYCVLI